MFALVSAAVTLPLAALSWFLIEKPSLSLKSRFFSNAAVDRRLLGMR
jgi:peptidoglycan/LPS O-acetylase OafA/YrhL